MIRTQYVVAPAEWKEAQTLWSQRACKKLPGAQAVQWVGGSLGLPIGLSLHLLPWWLVGLFVLTLAANIVFNRWRKRAVRDFLYANASDRDQPTDLMIDEGGYVSARPEFNECRMRWRCFTGWKEGASVFVLGRSTQFCIVPKQALSAEQQAELRDLLSSHLPAA